MRWSISSRTASSILDHLTFLATASDQTALEAMQSGAAQGYEFMGTPSLVKSFKSAGFQVTADPGNSTGDVQLNTFIAPFDNLKAREAMYYATDSKLLNEKVFDNTCAISESFTGPSGLFYEPKVPGYRTYDLARARALVKQLGGLSFSMIIGSTGTALEEGEALATMYKEAGMNVKIQTSPDLAAAIQDYATHKWQAIPASIGNWDPADAIGVAFRLETGETFTGVSDPEVDKLINAGAAAPTQAGRAKEYSQLASYLNQKAYTPFICAGTTWDIAAKGVEGPGLTTAIKGGDVGPQVLWEDVSAGNKA